MEVAGFELNPFVTVPSQVSAVVVVPNVPKTRLLFEVVTLPRLLVALHRIAPSAFVVVICGMTGCGLVAAGPIRWLDLLWLVIDSIAVWTKHVLWSPLWWIVAAFPWCSVWWKSMSASREIT